MNDNDTEKNRIMTQKEFDLGKPERERRGEKIERGKDSGKQIRISQIGKTKKQISTTVEIRKMKKKKQQTKQNKGYN